MAGKLTLVATPIGNLGDLSDRAREALRTAELWFVEDSRVSGKLQSVLGVKVPMKVLNEHTSPGQVEAYAELLANGVQAAALSDGGCPVISDPGALLIDALLESEVEIDAIPGPSAVTTALMLSGFFAQRFAFLGFLPRKKGPMAKELESFKDSPLTLVVFESPFRIEELLQVAAATFGNRRYCITRELTKLHQQIFRSELPIIPTESEVPRKGEFTVVIEGVRRKRPDTRE